MKASKGFFDLCKKWESLHDGDLHEIGLQPKMDCAGIWTEGYGHAMTDPETGKFLMGTENKAKAYKLHKVNNEEEAITLLEQDLIPREEKLNNLVKVPLTQNMYNALLDFFYNIGEGNFKKSTLLKKLNASNYRGAALEFDKWVYDYKKQKQPGLVNRRKEEKEMFLRITV